jgi:hypothetical protein
MYVHLGTGCNMEKNDLYFLNLFHQNLRRQSSIICQTECKKFNGPGGGGTLLEKVGGLGPGAPKPSR